MNGLDNLRELVLKNMEGSGYMNQIRAQLKLQVFKIVEGQDESTKQANGFEWQHPLTSQLKSMDHGINSLELLIEYLEFFKLDYTAQVLRKEANMPDIIIRESLAHRVGLQGKSDSMKPLLIIILAEFIKAVTEGFSPARRPDPVTRIPEKPEPKAAAVPQVPVKQPEPPIKAKKPEEPKKAQPEPRPQTAPVKKEAPATAVNKIRGAKQGGISNISNLYGIDNSSTVKDPYAMDFTKKAGADPYADPYAFDLDAPKATKFNSHELKAPAKKAEIEEDIDDFMESRDDKKQSNNMFTSSEDMMRATQSMGVDESVDSIALEEYDYYEDVTKKR